MLDDENNSTQLKKQSGFPFPDRIPSLNCPNFWAKASKLQIILQVLIYVSAYPIMQKCLSGGFSGPSTGLGAETWDRGVADTGPGCIRGASLRCIYTQRAGVCVCNKGLCKSQWSDTGGSAISATGLLGGDGQRINRCCLISLLIGSCHLSAGDRWKHIYCPCARWW